MLTNDVTQRFLKYVRVSVDIVISEPYHIVIEKHGELKINIVKVGLAQKKYSFVVATLWHTFTDL